MLSQSVLPSSSISFSMPSPPTVVNSWPGMGTKSLGSALVVGADGTRDGWVAAFLRGDRLRSVEFFADFESLMASARSCAVIGVDIPVGLLNTWRECDGAARALLGRRASTVFSTPPRPVLEASSYDQARALSRRLTDKAPSKQAYHLREKILEVDAFVGDRRLHEVHPELSFLEMAGGPLPPKQSWAGSALRQRALRGRGLVLPEEPGSFASKVDSKKPSLAS